MSQRNNDWLYAAAAAAAAASLTMTLAPVVEQAWWWGRYVFARDHIKRDFKGKWALITGASYGVGQAIATSLARRGVHLVLVARGAEGLKQVAEALHKAHGVQVIPLPLDLTTDQPEEAVRTALQRVLPPSASISLLVCNAGGAVPHMRAYQDWTVQEEESCRRLNGDAAYRLIRLVLPDMVSKGQGGIITISSVVHEHPTYMVPYGAEKAKLQTLSQGVANELHGSGVTMQCMMLAGVHTPGMLKSMPKDQPPKPSLFNPEPEAVAEAIMRWYKVGPTICTPYMPHAFQVGVFRMLWPSGLRAAASRAMSQGIKQVWDKNL